MSFIVFKEDGPDKYITVGFGRNAVLGIKNIHLGPSLPAFISPNVLKILVDKFNIIPITTAEEDIKMILGTGVKLITVGAGLPRPYGY